MLNERSGTLNWLAAGLFGICLTIAAAGAEGPVSTRPAGGFELTPRVLGLDSVPERAMQASCVLRATGTAPAPVVAVEPTNPALRATWRKDRPSGAYVVTAEFPPGYTVPPGRTVEVLVRTEGEREPALRIPVRVNTRPYNPNPQWLSEPGKFVGQPAPFVHAERLLGGDVQIGAGMMGDAVTVLLFAAHWCDHCEIHVPEMEALRREYAEPVPIPGHRLETGATLHYRRDAGATRNGEEPQWIAVLPTTGTGQAAEEAARHWGARLDVGWARTRYVAVIHMPAGAPIAGRACACSCGAAPAG